MRRDETKYFDKELVSYFVALFLFGAAIAAVTPYQSLIAIHYLKMDSQSYSVVLLLMSILSLLVSPAVGHMSDRRANQSTLLLFCIFVAIVGHFTFFSFRSEVAFLFLLLLATPISSAIFPQVFATIKSHSTLRRKAKLDLDLSVGRSLFSLSWVIIPPLVSVLIYYGIDLPGVYALSAALLAACGIFIWQARPSNGPLKRTLEPKKPGRLGGLLNADVLLGILCISLAEGATKLHGIFFPLLIVGIDGGSVEQVGFLSGMIALLEIPLILLWAVTLKFISKEVVLVIAMLIYAVYALLLFHAHSIVHIYVLIPLNVIGASALISVAITFLQDLIPEQVGLASSLITVADTIGWLIASLVFFIYGGIQPIQNLSLASAAISALGAVLMFFLVVRRS